MSALQFSYFRNEVWGRTFARCDASYSCKLLRANAPIIRHLCNVPMVAHVEEGDLSPVFSVQRTPVRKGVVTFDCSSANFGLSAATERVRVAVVTIWIVYVVCELDGHRFALTIRRFFRYCRRRKQA